MFLVESNRARRLLHLNCIGRVTVAEMEAGLADAVALLADLPPGFQLLTDLERLDHMEIGCADVIGRLMELCDQKGVESVVRIVPKPDKDIGLNILTLFHYKQRPTVVTCDTLAEAARVLGF
jgi:hypothetical protein